MNSNHRKKQTLPKQINQAQKALVSNYHSFLYLKKAPKTLELVLKSKFKKLPLEHWEQVLKVGSLYINGKSVQNLQEKLVPPVKIEYYQAKKGLGNLFSTYSPFDLSRNLIFEDQYLIVVFKPAWLPTMPAKEQKLISLYSYLKKEYGSVLHFPSRLDFSTSGLVLISKSIKTHNPVNKLFEKRKINKTYLFKSHNQAQWNKKTLELKIDKDPHQTFLRTTSKYKGKIAKTFFKKLNSKLNNLFQAKPETGRTHQIRVHASALGLPIIGDVFYGGMEASELHLTCYQLEFLHPITKRLIKVKTPLGLLPKWV